MEQHTTSSCWSRTSSTFRSQPLWENVTCWASNCSTLVSLGYFPKQLLEQNKQYIQEPATVGKYNLLGKQLFYTRLARLFPLPFVGLALGFYFGLSFQQYSWSV
ncbi:uncharacterized protein LOC130756750 isoform X3 [Actinidia eriantha]|uniref:uncharacterized protein LOC130756750 isoform X3 n=1 Tax=Actinidia eriantha TaxID=165200 RepID=UPI0025889FEF|nr:uncharacterized protein LOC130756750 isoform X3 [Actinidia eriantha]